MAVFKSFVVRIAKYISMSCLWFELVIITVNLSIYYDHFKVQSHAKKESGAGID
jgi:hypothetical protein